MANMNQENQLELFDLTHQPAARLQRETLGRVFLHVRYDQLVLASMAGLIGIAVVFACGVERGKRLVRSERMLLARQQLATAQVEGNASSSQASSVTRTEKKQPPAPPVPSVAPKKSEPVKVAATTSKVPSTNKGTGTSRYAIQVVTYSQPVRAKKEVERLHARGERAFLLMRDDRTIVYVGPFPSKGNATEKLGLLKTQYRDCFLRLL